MVRSMRKAGIFQKSDERILGDGDFVDSVLAHAREAMEKRYLLPAKGVKFKDVVSVAAKLYAKKPQNFIGASKERLVVRGRALICFWAVRELGMSMTTVAEHLKVAVPTVSIAVKKGEHIANEEGIRLIDLLNVKM